MPPIQPEQVAALDLLAEGLHVEAPFTPGDMRFLNQYISYYGRTADADDAEARKQRVLYRTWLSTPNGRPLPAGHAVQWGPVAAAPYGAARSVP